MRLSKGQATAIVGAGLGLWLCGHAVQANPWYSDQGLASYYGKGFHGRKTASGERFSQNEMTAAHRQLPLGTKVMVENRETGEQVEVKTALVTTSFTLVGSEADLVVAANIRPTTHGQDLLYLSGEFRRLA